MKLEQLLDDRFDLEDDGEEVKLICTKCSASVKIPSAIDAVLQGDPIDHANQIMSLVRRILAHLDKCNGAPRSEAAGDDSGAIDGTRAESRAYLLRDARRDDAPDAREALRR